MTNPQQTFSFRPLFDRVDLVGFAVIICLLNVPLLTGHWNSAFAFHPLLVKQGEWWRVLSFPFVHVSTYHLVLDAAAFFLLYSGLREKSLMVRAALFFGTALTSLVVSVYAAPEIFTFGLCGLSGVAHGLMAISGIEMFETEDKTLRFAGVLTFALVLVKAAIEAVTGEVIFAGMHGGNLGTPIAVCHAGGILGALLTKIGLGIIRRTKKRGTFQLRASLKTASA